MYHNVMKINETRMSFDQLQRYRLAAELIEEVRGNATLSILDAGSREGYLGGFLPDDKIIGVDRSDFSGDRFIKGDVLCLPFPDRSFDIVLTLDVLEHIPERERLKFLGELKRVSRKAVILGAPFKSGEVEEAERIINDFSRDRKSTRLNSSHTDISRMPSSA